MRKFEKKLFKMSSLKKLAATVLSAAFVFTAFVIPTEAASGTWNSDGSGWWYSYSDGSYAQNTWVDIDGSWYYFGANGYMDYSSYRDGYWLNADGTCSTGYSGGHWEGNNTGGWWYTDASGWYPVSQWLWIDGKCYYFKASGFMATDEWVDGCYLDKSGAWVQGKTKGAQTAWMAAYEKVVNDYASKNKETKYGKIRYALIYLDGDDIPELVCGKQGYYVSLYTYYNNKAVCVMDNWAYGAGGNVGYSYSERTGLVSNSNSDMAGSIRYITYYELKNGKLQQTDYYYCTASYNLKSYGFDWKHSSDADYHYYRIPTKKSSSGYKNYEEISKATYDSYQKETSGYIQGGSTKDEILGKLK